jgi:hypothetical protein
MRAVDAAVGTLDQLEETKGNKIRPSKTEYLKIPEGDICFEAERIPCVEYTCHFLELPLSSA